MTINVWSVINMALYSTQILCSKMGNLLYILLQLWHKK